MNKPLTFGSLFAGIGGIDLGLERAGFQCKWQVEIDEYAQKVLAKHWPDVARFRDIRDCGKHNLPYVDLLCGGFPCQDISQAGKRAGIKGQRSGLWSEFHRLICELRPSFVLVENVSDLLVRGIERVLADLASSGYDAEWQMLSAAAFGAYHLRERLFILAYSQGKYQQKQSLYTSKGWIQTKSRGNWYTLSRPCWQTDQPSLVGMANGLSDWLDRSRTLGNAVVPQIAEYIGRCIMAVVESEATA